MPERGFVPYNPPPEQPNLRELILRCKDQPGQRFRVGIWEKKGSAERAAYRHRIIFELSEPNIEIRSARLHDIDGWGVIVRYLPPDMVRDGE